MLGTVVGLGAVCAGSLACQGADAGLLAQVAGSLLAGAMPGIAGNLIASDVEKHLAKRVVDPSAALQNHDLNRLVAEAIELSLREFAQLELEGDPAAALQRLAEEALEQWPRICRWPGIARLSEPEIHAALEAQLPDLLASAPRDPRAVSTLDVKTWRALLNYLARKSGVADSVTRTTRRRAAVHLAQRFAWAFREKAKADFENGGRAYAGLHLMALGELLATARASATTLDSIAAALPNLERAVSAASAALLEQMDAKARRRHRATLGRMIELQREIGDLSAAVGGMQIQLAELATQRGATPDELREVLRTAFASLPRLVAPEPRTLLKLDLRRPLDHEGKNLASKLLARNRAIPLIGRDEEMAQLTKWLGDPAPVGIRVIAGEAGVGKTRLAIELCERAAAVGWHAGLAGNEALESFASEGAIHWDWDDPTLVVIDYASGKVDFVERLLRGLAEQRSSISDRPRVRLLLLDRHRGAGLPWWERLFSPSASEYGDAIRAWYLPDHDRTLTTLADRDSRMDLLRAATSAFGHARELDDRALQYLTAQLDSLRLSATPLLMQLAAIYHLEHGSNPDLTRDSLLEWYREREKQEVLAHLPFLHGADDQPLFFRLVAFATLLQGHELPVGLVRQIVDAECHELGCEVISPRKARDLLRDYLGEREGKIEPLAPDLIAEHWVLHELPVQRDAARPNVPPFLELALKTSPFDCGGFLIRAAQDFTELEDRWRVVEQLAKAKQLPESAVDGAAQALPWETTALRPLALELERLRLDACRQRAASGAPKADCVERGAELARLLYHFSFRLSELDFREDALATAEESTTLFRALAGARPDDFTPALATSLNNLSVQLGNLGRHEGALAAIEEAASLHRALAGARPDAFTPALATSLNNLSVQLGNLGRHEEALASIEEAASLHRALAGARPDAFTPALASSLNILSVQLGNLGRHEGALAAIEEAASLHRALAGARPDAFTPDLASSLNNLSVQLSGLGRREEALAAIEEATTLRRALAGARPDAFTPDLPSSLNNLSVQLSGLGRREEALAAIEEATTLSRALARARPVAFTPELARSLNTLSNRLNDLGRREEALAASEEATTLYRAVARVRLDAFTPYLASSLNNLSVQLSGLGRREEALAAIEEATTLFRALAGARPDAFTPQLAMSVNNLGLRLSDVGRHDEALATIEEATTLYRALAGARPDAFTYDLARSCSVQSILLSGSSRAEEALVLSEEATRLIREPLRRWPKAMGALATTILGQYVQQAAALGREPDAQLVSEIRALLGDA